MVLRQNTEKRDLDIGHAKEKFYYVLFGINQFLPRVIKLGVLVWNMTWFWSYSFDGQTV